MSLLKRASNIIEGWRNHLLPPSELKTLIDEVHAERMAICALCPYNSANQKPGSDPKCTLCGCPLEKKTKCLSCNCGAERHNERHPESPIALRWAAVTSLQEDIAVEAALKDQAS